MRRIRDRQQLWQDGHVSSPQALPHDTRCWYGPGVAMRFRGGFAVAEYSQWHYIFGYLIGLTGHNWPIMLCTACGLYYAWRLYQRPRARDVRLLYGWALLGVAYEYRKHLQGVFDEAVDFLLVWHFWQWNRWGHALTDAFFLAIIALALWMFWAGWRARNHEPLVGVTERVRRQRQRQASTTIRN